MTDEQLDELERLERAATPGPWVARETTKTELKGALFNAAESLSDHVRIGAYWTDEEHVARHNRVGMVDHISNADILIALKARNALPALIAEVRRLRAMVGEDAPAVSSEEHVRTNESLENFKRSVEHLEAVAERAARCAPAVAPEDAATEAALDAAGVLH